jgi:outer membrane immunogenic protein
MKKALSLAAAALALSAGSALAADLPSRKAPPPAYLPPPPMMIWTGFYAGVNVGGAWAASNNFSSPAWDAFDEPAFLPGFAAATSASTLQAGGNNGGFLGGAQIGYNYQFGSNFLVGVEADIQGFAGNRSNVDSLSAAREPVSGSIFVTSTQTGRSLDYLGTVRGRLGYLVTPSLLVYGTGGLAYGNANYRVASFTRDSLGLWTAGVGGGSYSALRAGWTAGGGVEWMFWPNWSAKVEYLYYDLGTVRANSGAVAGLSTGAAGHVAAGVLGWAYSPTSAARFDGHMVRAGVNYHLNWGGAPIVARY